MRQDLRDQVEDVGFIIGLKFKLIIEQQRRMQVHDENVASQVKVPQYTLISSYKTQGVPTTGFFQLL